MGLSITKLGYDVDVVTKAAASAARVANWSNNLLSLIELGFVTCALVSLCAGALVGEAYHYSAYVVGGTVGVLLALGIYLIESVKKRLLKTMGLFAMGGDPPFTMKNKIRELVDSSCWGLHADDGLHAAITELSNSMYVAVALAPGTCMLISLIALIGCQIAEWNAENWLLYALMVLIFGVMLICVMAFMHFGFFPVLQRVLVEDSLPGYAGWLRATLEQAGEEAARRMNEVATDEAIDYQDDVEVEEDARDEVEQRREEEMIKLQRLIATE